MQASEISGTLFQNLSFRSERNKVIASNIANINTPNYKTKDLIFENELQKANSSNDLKMSRTHKNHMDMNLSENKMNTPRLIDVDGLVEQNDGNNVSLDKQVGDMAKNTIMFDAISNAIKKDSRLFRSIIESSAKN